MKRLLNTLFVTTQGSYLNKDGEAVVVSVEHEIKLRIPVHTIQGIVCFGNVMMSPYLMHHCAENGVGISMLSEQGRFLARVHGPVSGNVLLRKEQYRRSEQDSGCVEIVRSIVMGKIANCRTVLQRAARDHGEKVLVDSMTAAILRLGRAIEECADAVSVEQLRGKEGDAARIYFENFDNLITAQKSDFFLKQRSRRPPLDNMNALLSFLYTLLVHDCSSALEAVGLDPQVGFLHKDRPGRPSLALDLMEEFRPVIADRVALSLVNLRQLQAGGFRKTESGAVEMTDDSRKELLVAYQKRKQEEIMHPYLEEKVTVGMLPFCQAMLMARFLRGDIDGYPVFVWK